LLRSLRDEEIHRDWDKLTRKGGNDINWSTRKPSETNELNAYDRSKHC
jgi:hypothetical protein